MTNGMAQKKRYLCDKCDFETSRKSDMEEHLQMHNRKEKFQCPRCTYSATKQRFIDQHLKKNHRNAIQDDSMLQRVQVMKEKVRLAKEDLDCISAKLENVRKRKMEMQNPKDARPSFFIALKTEATQFRTSPDAVSKSGVAGNDLVEAEFRALEEEEAALSEDLESAIESHFGAQQVLGILEAQMKRVVN